MQFTVNKNMGRLLRQMGKSQASVSRRSGISSAVLSKIVRCKRKVYADEVVPIATAMGVSVESLFMDSASA